MKLSRKLLIPTIAFFAIVLLAFITFSTLDAARNQEIQEDRNLTGFIQIFNSRINSLQNLAVALAVETANNPEVQQAFATGNRERLTELTYPAYEKLDASFDIPQFQFHLPPATSFLRLHQLDSFGDDLSSFRQTVLQANNNRQTISGIEMGRGGLGIRGVVPVSYQGQHIGTVEFGSNVDQTLLDGLKQDFGVNWQIYLKRDLLDIATLTSNQQQSGPTPDLLLQATTLPISLYAEPAAYPQVLSGQTVISRLSANNRDYAVISAPLLDFSGQIIGVVEAVSDRTEVLASQTRSQTIAIIASVAALLMLTFGLTAIAVHVLRPIGQLTQAATAIAEGDLNHSVPLLNSNDELEILSTSFNRMTGQLRDLVGQLEQRVTARTQRLEIVASLSERLNAILDLNELLAEVVNQVKDNFGYYHAHIYLLDEKGEKLVVAEGTGPAGAEMKVKGHAIRLDTPTSLVARAARTGEIVRVDNVREAKDWLPNPLLPNTYSEMAVPIISEGKVVGVLDVQQDRVAGLDDGDESLLRSLANQVSVEIRNARQFAEVEASLKEAREIQQRYIEQAWDRTRVTRKNMGRVRFSLGESTTLSEGLMVEAQQRALRYKKPEVVGLGNGNDHHALIAPISLRDVVIGDLQLHEVDPKREWTESEMALISAVIDQVAQAAENLRLLDETQERASREQLVSQISNKMRRAPDMDSLLKVAVAELSRALNPARTFVHMDLKNSQESDRLKPETSNGNGVEQLSGPEEIKS